MRAVGVRTDPCTQKSWYLPYNMEGRDCVDFANKRHPAPKFKPKAAAKKAAKAKAKSVGAKAKAKSVAKAKAKPSLPGSAAASSKSSPAKNEQPTVAVENKEEGVPEKNQMAAQEEKKVDDGAAAIQIDDPIRNPIEQKATISKDTAVSDETAVTNEPASASDSVSKQSAGEQASASASKGTASGSSNLNFGSGSSASKNSSSGSSENDIGSSGKCQELTEDEFARMEAEFMADAERTFAEEANSDSLASTNRAGLGGLLVGDGYEMDEEDTIDLDDFDLRRAKRRKVDEDEE
jgi:hypothetical protein